MHSENYITQKLTFWDVPKFIPHGRKNGHDKN